MHSQSALASRAFTEGLEYAELADAIILFWDLLPHCPTLVEGAVPALTGLANFLNNRVTGDHYSSDLTKDDDVLRGKTDIDIRRGSCR